MRVDALTPLIDAAPGDEVTCRVRIKNDGSRQSSYHLRVVGFDDDHVLMPPTWGALDAGDEIDVDLRLLIPEAFAAGNHALGVEVSSDSPGEAHAIAGITVSVGSPDRFVLSVNPSTVRGRRRGKFWIDVLNRDVEPVDIELAGEGPDVVITAEPQRLTVAPGQRARSRGRVRGPRLVVGEPVQRSFTVTARSRSAPSYAAATFAQRPVLPTPLRTVVAVITVLALWAGALALGVRWWANRGGDAPSAAVAELVDTDGDGVAETPGDQMLDTDGDGVADTLAAEVAAAVAAAAAASTDQEGKPPRTDTEIGGTVKAGDTGQNDGVIVTLTPMEFGAPAPPKATFVGGGAARAANKLWPARFGRHQAAGALAARRTITVTSATSDADGAFLFADVLIRQNYEVNFAKNGFDSQSFVVTPAEDGKPAKLEVALEPSKGSLGGSVVGPGGPLGNVDISATDGTLTYKTTSSTEPGKLGAFSLSAVNTPATYTITATLRGYGTQVVQVELGPGDTPGNIRISMTPGVGSIIGHVTSGGQPLGGATLTASNADVTRTATSLTEGDRGLYDFPQLDIPSDYTVTATAEGYITQTRLIALNDNLTGADFDLVKTTASITGIVVSNAKGPLPGALVTITKDDLTFTTSTAATPEPGSFTVDDLPPGTYLVRFSRFDHADASQLVTLSAGESKDLGQIDLLFTGVAPPPRTGSVSVRVVDSLNADLTGATVTLTDVGTGTQFAQLSDGAGTQATFLFENVPVGTYTVLVTRPRYREGFQRVSVGLGPQSVVVPLFLLGQASGRVIDSLTRDQLTNYEVTIVRLNPDATETVVQRVVVPANAQPNPLTGEIRWETTPNSLTTGIYRVDVTDPPPGYRVLGDQVIDANNPNAPVMQFEIKPTDEDPLKLNDIEADPYPTLKGKIFKPLLTNPTTNEVSFVPIDDNALAVTLSCPGAPNVVAAVLSDEDPAVPGLDTYFFDAVTLESNALLGTCVITVSAPGFVSASVTMDPPLQPSDGLTRSDQIVNIALVAPNDPIAGPVVWIDHGLTPAVERTADGVTVATEGSVIIGFNRAQGTDPAAPPTPQFAPSPLTSVTSGGVWRLDGQVFGQTTYSFTDPTRFDTGKLTVTIDETTNRQVAAVQSLVVEDRGVNGGIHVELTPRPGVITGRTPVTTVLTPRFTDVHVQAVGPNGVTAAPASNAPDGAYSINPAAAGTWSLSYSANGDVPPDDPRDYSLATGSAATVTTLVNPGAAVDLGATTFVEHPRIDFLVTDSAGNPINVNGVTPTLNITPLGGLGAPASQQTDPVTGRTIFRRLAFNPANPLALVGYGWSVTMPGFDLLEGNAGIVLNGAGGFDVSRHFVPIQGAVSLRAGAKPLITISLPRFGSLTGNVVGRFGSRADSPTQPIALTDAQLVVTARRVLSLDTNGGTRQFTAVNDPPVPAVIDPNDPNGFSVSGPPGAYLIDISHPQYSGLVAQPAGAPDCTFFFFLVCNPGQVPRILLPPGAVPYLIENDVDTNLVDPFVLEIRRMQLNFHVITNRTTNGPVGGASVHVTQGVEFDGSNLTDGAGLAPIASVIPGTNQLEVRNLRVQPNLQLADINFPVLATIDVPRFSAANNGQIDVTVVMPELGNRVGGAIAAVNSEGDPVPLPADVVIDRVYHTAPGDIGGVPFDNTAREGQTPGGDVNFPGGVGPLTQLTVTQTAPPGTPVPFEFANIAAGLHDLTFSAEAGYTAPTPNPRSVTVVNALPNDLGQLVYRANDVRVVVNVTSLGAPLSTALVGLVSPDPGEILIPTQAGGTFEFAAVPPEVLDYTLNITDDLHTAVSQAVRVSPDPDGVLTVNIAITPSVGRIEGVARKDLGSGPVPMANEGTVQLQLPDGTAVGAPVTPGPTGNYRFDVTTAGDYRVVASLTGFASRSVDVPGVALGRLSNAPFVTVLALATATITITGSAAAEPTLALAVTQPAASGLTPVKNGAVFTVGGLDPDVNYRFQATANGFFPALIPAAAALNPDIGGAHSFSVALTERTVAVTVTTEDASGTENAAIVRLRIPPASTTPLSPTTTVGNVYTFARIPTGAGQVSVAATGYRTQTAAVDASTASQAVTVNLPLLVSITGTVFAANGTTAVPGATVTVTNGTSTRTTVSAADGTYTVANLDVATWTPSAVKLGGGTATAAAVVVTATSPSTVTRNFTLAPRQVAVGFTVQAGAPAAPLAGATVSVDGNSQTTGATGTATVNTPENGALAWRVAATNRLTQSGTITLTALTAAVSVTLIDRPTLTGTVANGNNPRNGATVLLCPNAAAVCNATTAAAQATTPAAGTFSFRPDVGTWQVRAVLNNGNDAFVTNIIVDATGNISQNNLAISL